MDGDAQVVQDLGRVLPVEIAGGNYLAPFGEHDLKSKEDRRCANFIRRRGAPECKYRIIGAAVHFRRYDLLDELDGVVNDPVNLGAAAKGVGVLNPVAKPVTFWGRKRLKLHNFDDGFTWECGYIVYTCMWPLFVRMYLEAQYVEYQAQQQDCSGIVGRLSRLLLTSQIQRVSAIEKWVRDSGDLKKREKQITLSV